MVYTTISSNQFHAYMIALYLITILSCYCRNSFCFYLHLFTLQNCFMNQAGIWHLQLRNQSVLDYSKSFIHSLVHSTSGGHTYITNTYVDKHQQKSCLASWNKRFGLEYFRNSFLMHYLTVLWNICISLLSTEDMIAWLVKRKRLFCHSLMAMQTTFVSDCTSSQKYFLNPCRETFRNDRSLFHNTWCGV